MQRRWQKLEDQVRGIASLIHGRPCAPGHLHGNDIDGIINTAPDYRVLVEITVQHNLAKVRVSAHYRVAGHDYRLLAGGHTHFTMYNKLMPWDHLAGTLIVQEAGGYAARFDGSPYLPGQTSGGLIVATDRETWNLLRKEVFTV